MIADKSSSVAVGIVWASTKESLCESTMDGKREHRFVSIDNTSRHIDYYLWNFVKYERGFIAGKIELRV